MTVSGWTASRSPFPDAFFGRLDDLAQPVAVVAEAATVLRAAGGFSEPEVSLRTPSGPDHRGDPLHAVVARRSGPSS